MGDSTTRGLVTSVTKVSAHLVRITLRVSRGLKYHPGQWIRLAHNVTELRRGEFTSFQLSSCPTQALRTNQYEVFAETGLLPQFVKGLGRVRVGDLLWLEGPFGNFWPLSARPHEQVVWVATPASIGPFLSCIRSQNFEKMRPRKILLIVQVSREDEMPWRKCFESKGVTVLPCVEYPSEWIEGFWGSVLGLFNHSALKLDFSKCRFFLSLENSTNQEVFQALVEKKRVSVNQIVMNSEKTTQAGSVKERTSRFFQAA